MSKTIYEFSTGIYRVGNISNWRSSGFTGGWINSTYSPEKQGERQSIPASILKAIDNGEFDLAEEDRSKVTVMGKVVKYDGTEWSVVVTSVRGRDERREAPFYRYFFCEGSNPSDMMTILETIGNYYENQNHLIPIFNPFQEKPLFPTFSPKKYSIDSLPFLSVEDGKELQSLQVKTAVLHPPSSASLDHLYLIRLYQLAVARNEANGRPIAWAYNVQALANPDLFSVIQAENMAAYRDLKLKRAGSGTKYIEGVSNQYVKEAIERMPLIEHRYFQQLEDSFKNEEIDNGFLSSIFSGLGVDSVLRKGNTHPNMISLLTFRAILTREAVFSFLVWIEKCQKDGKDNSIKISKDFRVSFFGFLSQYPNEFPRLRSRISRESSQAVLEALLGKEITCKNLYPLIDKHWITKERILDAIEQGIKEVDIAVAHHAVFSGADIWKPLEAFIKKVKKTGVSTDNYQQKEQAYPKLHKFFKNLLPKFIVDDLDKRLKASKQTRIALAKAKEQENRLIQAEVYYSPLAELLRMLHPTSDEHLYFDYVSNPQQRLPLAYSAIGIANNTREKLFNLIIDNPISINKIRVKLLAQQISFFSLVIISVVVIPLFYLLFIIVQLIAESSLKAIKYIFND